jgi:hypothetical protein
MSPTSSAFPVSASKPTENVAVYPVTDIKALRTVSSVPRLLTHRCPHRAAATGRLRRGHLLRKPGEMRVGDEARADVLSGQRLEVGCWGNRSDRCDGSLQ